MKVLLVRLADFAWVLYAGCALGAVVYIARALSLQRQLARSLTVFERETMATQVARLWRLALAFVALGGVLLLGQIYLFPQVIPQEQISPTSTLGAGLVTLTPSPSPTPTPLMGALPTIAPTTPLTVPPPPSPPPEPTSTPTPAGPSPAYPFTARLGDVAELIGYDLSSTEVSSDQTVRLTLYWRALEGAGAADYWVFTHLLPPQFDRLLGQHDGAPAGGTRPTTGWTVGEVIVDAHEMVFYEAGYSGPAQIAVGLYDPTTMVRVSVAGGGDYVLLPTTINVVVP